MRIARDARRRSTAPVRTALTTLVATAIAAAGLTACASSAADTAGSGGTLRVVAATNVWGSIAEQLGGPHVEVVSIVSDPRADPHDYEPTAAAGRAVATADVVLVNGLGYDAWATRLADASPSSRRVLVSVADVTGAESRTTNPHLWYDPAAVDSTIDALTAAYQRLDPAHSDDYAASARAFRTDALAGYTAAIEEIRAQHSGAKIGASESVVAPLADALGLDLVTPAGFLDAVSEGVDPTAGDKRAADAQLSSRVIAVYVHNAQNSTPDVRAQVGAARAAGIPVTSVTETLTPAGATFQEWQTTQLQALGAALDRAAAR